MDARVAALEREIARLTDEAQREADAMYAQYQLSQILASGGRPADLGAAVAAELMRLCGAATVRLWLAEPTGGALRLAAIAGTVDEPVPESFADLAEGVRWAELAGATTTALVDDRPAGIIAVSPPPGRSLDPEGLRVLRLVRHELAIAFRSAGLRAALEREREELTAVVEGAADAILQVDADRRLIRINRAALDHLGSAAEDVLGSTCGDALGCARSGGHDDAACPLAEVLRTGVPITVRETAIAGADGRPIAMLGAYSRVTGGGGEPRATAILRDVSAARALQELREGFVATVSHELRTPLALVKGYAETLLHLDLPPEEQRRIIERIDQLAERLRGLLTQILDVTHLQADPLVLERSPVRLDLLVERLRADLGVAGGRDRLVSDLPAHLPPVVADPVRLSQVLENLVGNAIKYAPDESPIRITAERERETLVVHVDDEGIGVPDEDLGLVDQPFHRGRNVRESTIPGTGLGLAISRRLVEAHGGRLWLERRPDGRHGTRASFSLPVARSRRRTPAAAPASPPGTGVAS